ncbi:retrovirus-related Pol polyprotein from transposon 412 [Nephila pilipes]|uniref:Retrovirus-related Pol polyprotein from transposon 412 n=1 Tax=Nephila pilipes TaxID=299642 RepID=A0A8X6QX17_NEPPI|nr:retrovirus-related Pol polyprotein from transposon 412 [Nephila pilipes]
MDSYMRTVPMSKNFSAHKERDRKFRSSYSGFQLVLINLVGLFRPSEGFHYCLPCVDRFIKWPEAFPLVEISIEAIAKTYTGWIYRLGQPLRLTNNQETQFN